MAKGYSYVNGDVSNIETQDIKKDQSFFSMLVRSSFIYAGIKGVAKMEAFENTSLGKNSSLATAVALGAAFVANAFQDNSNLAKNALSIMSVVAAPRIKNNILENYSTELYSKIETFNKYVQKVDDFSQRYAEWGMESRQLLRERTTEQSFSDVMLNSVKQFGNYVVQNKNDLQRSDAYNVIKNNPENLLTSQYLTSHDYEKLSNLPPTLQDYVNDYTRINMRIGKTTYKTTAIADSLGYFMDFSKTNPEAFGNVDPTKVFREGLNDDLAFIKSEAESYKATLPSRLKNEDSLYLYQQHLKETFNVKESEIALNNPELNSDEIFGLAKQHFLDTDENLSLKILLNKQAGNTHLSLGEYSDILNKDISKSVENLKTSVNSRPHFNPQSQSANKTSQSDLDNINIFKDKLNSYRNDNNTLVSNSYKSQSSDILSSNVYDNVDPSSTLFTNLSTKDNKYDFIANMRVHKNIEKGENGLMDTTVFDSGLIGKSALAVLENHFTPYFKALPFLPDSFRRFNAFALFKTNERIVNSLSDTTVNVFKEANYNVDESIHSVKDFLSSVRFLVDDVKNQDSESFSFKNSIMNLNKNISDNGGINNSFGISSEIKFDRRKFNVDDLSQSVSGKSKDYVLKELRNIEEKASQEHNNLLTLKSDDYRGFDAYYSDESSKAYHSYYLNFGDDGASFDKSLRNSNNVVVINNTSYVRNASFVGNKYEGSYGKSFVKAEDDVIYTRSNYVKQYQSDRAGNSVTTFSSKSGFYVNDDEAIKDYSLNDIYNSKNKLKAYRESDYNILPSTHGSVHDEANLFSQYSKRIKELRSVYDYAKVNDKNLQVDDIVMYAMGKNSRLKLSAELEDFEINKVAKSIVDSGKESATDFTKYKSFLYEMKKIDSTVLEGEVGVKNANFINNFDTARLENVSFDSDFFKYQHNSFLENIRDIKKTINTSESPYFDDAKKIYNELDLDTDSNLKTVLRSRAIDRATLTAEASKTSSDVSSKVNEINRQTNKKMISSFFKLSDNYDNFLKTVGEETMEGNTFINLDRLRHMDRANYIEDAEGTIIKKAFSNLDLSRDGVALTMKKVFSEFNDTSKYSNNANILATEIVEKIENTFNSIGIRKLDLSNKATSVDYVNAFLKKRVYNVALTVAAFWLVNSGFDALVPDNTPVIGEGLVGAFGTVLASVRYGFQVAVNTLGLGGVFRELESKYPGMFTDNGFFSVFDLSDTNEEAYGKYFEGDEIAIRKNRFWFTSGRSAFEGGEIEGYRKSLFYSLQHRDSDVYDSKIERFFRKDFLPTSIAWTIADPYLEEREMADRGDFLPKSEQKFTDIFLIGGLLNSTLGEAIKPTIYFHEDTWRVDKDTIINPNYNPNDPNSSKTLKTHEPNVFEKSFIPAYDDLIRMSGMSGYIFNAANQFLFGNPYTTQGTYTLDSLDRHNSFSQQFFDLKLGGMIGTTEPLRRIWEPNKLKNNTINPVVNTATPSWLPQNYFKDFNYGIHDLGINDESMRGLSESSDFYTKLKTLAINAPYSSEFSKAKNEMIKRLQSGSVSDSDAYRAYQAFSYANGIIGNNVSEDTSVRADLVASNVTVGSVTDVGMFTDKKGNRYKISGIAPNSDNPYGKTEKSEELLEFMKEVSKNKTFTAFSNADSSFATKTDELGTYKEIYIPELDKFKTLKEKSYLRENYQGHNFLQDANETFSNFFKASYLEKYYNNKDVVGRFVDESVTTPQFKSWTDPLNTFIMPYLTEASRGTKGYLSSLAMSGNVGDGSLALPALETLSYAFGMVNRPFNPKEYTHEDIVQNTYEMQMKAQGKQNIYDLKGGESLNILKNMLSPTERKYFKEMVNVNDEETRQELYDAGSARLRSALQNAWKTQARNSRSDFQSYESDYEKNFVVASSSDMSFTGDSDTMFAEIRNQVFGTETSYEKPIINSLISNNSYNKVDFDRIDRMLSSQKTIITRKRILSTTYLKPVDTFE